MCLKGQIYHLFYSASGDRLYDSAALKLPGRRGVVDDNLVSGECIKEKKDKNDKSTKNGQSVVSSNSFSYIGTLNVRPARERYKQLELASLFLESGSW